MILKIYVYEKCGTCKKALKFLEAAKITFQSIPIREKPPTQKELRFMLDQYEGDLKKLFNTSGKDYRELGIKDQLSSMSKKEAIELLSQNGNLIKRPFALTDDSGLVGFHEATWNSVFSSK